MSFEIKYHNSRIRKYLDKYSPQEKKKILDIIENKLKNLSPFTKGIKKIKSDLMVAEINTQHFVLQLEPEKSASEIEKFIKSVK